MQDRTNPIGAMLSALVSFALLSQTQAVNPPRTPDPGPKPVSNTADGQNALLSITTGIHNTAIGFDSLLSNTDANFNTGVGSVTLLLNTGSENTAVGAGALFSNNAGVDNTANGVFALFNNTEGHDNTAIGDFALFSNTVGANNTASGRVALYNNVNGSENTASGLFALLNNIDGSDNTATGDSALHENVTGDENTAVGVDALFGNTGSSNTALGAHAGQDLTTGNNNIDIGFNVVGVAAESNTIRIGNTDITDAFIRGISGATAAGGVAVFVNSSGHLGTTTSSARFKDEIKPMGDASEAILALRPVSFRYKKEIDPQGIPEFGLIAEEVEKVNPDLIIRDKEGKPYTVRYEQINAMLLNEFLKEHKRLEEEQATIAELKSTIAQQHRGFEATTARQKKEVEALAARLKEQAAQIEKVSAKLELHKPAPRMVLNNPQKLEN